MHESRSCVTPKQTGHARGTGRISDVCFYAGSHLQLSTALDGKFGTDVTNAGACFDVAEFISS